MLIEQIIEFQLRGPGPPGRTCLLWLVYFMTNQKYLWIGHMRTIRIGVQ